jgi:3-methyladenine DNA glycosylase AlkD
MSSAPQILSHLLSLKNARNISGMARFGINPGNTIGISMPVLRKIASAHKNDHLLAEELWKSGYHEARILASMVANPKLLTKAQMDEWTEDFRSWDLCDQVCGNLFSKTQFVKEKIEEYAQRPEEFVKRTAFSLMAAYAVKGKTEKDEFFVEMFPIIEREAGDERNYVKKAVNWALRQIGKRNKGLCEKALECAERIKGQGTKSARWIANDAIRELSAKIKNMI